MSTGAGSRPPLHGISDTDHGGIIICFVVGSLLFSLSFATIRFVLSARKNLGFWYDDLFIALCLVFSIIHGVLVADATHFGLGKHITTLESSQITKFFKLAYASRIVAVFSFSFAKYSLALLYKRLDLYRSKIANIVLLSAITIWMVFGVFATAFQCGASAPWHAEPSRCTSAVAVISSVAAVNFITDLLLVAYPFYGILKLAMSGGMKFAVLALFSSRLATCAMIIAEVVYFKRAFNKDDITWEMVTPAVMSVVLVMLSLVTSTAPRIHSFLATISTGQTTVKLPSMILYHKRSRVDNASHNNTLPPSRDMEERSNTPRRDLDKPEPLDLVPRYDNVLTTEITSENGQKKGSKALV